MSIMNSIVIVLCLVITRIYGLNELVPATTTVFSVVDNLTEFITELPTTALPVESIVTTYEPVLIPIPTTNPKYNTENIDNNVNGEKNEKFSPNIYAETIFLPVAPNNYRPDLTHESLSRSHKFNLLDFTGYIHPPVLPSPEAPKAEKLVDSHLNIDPSEYRRLLKKAKKGKSKKGRKNDNSNYPSPYAARDENYYPNNFYEYFKNDFYRNHRDRYDIDAENSQHYPRPSNAGYYHQGGGSCPGGHQNLLQKPRYYNYALQPIQFHGHPKGRAESEEEEEEEEEGDEEDEEEESEQVEEGGEPETDKKESKEPAEEKTSEKQQKAENGDGEEEEQAEHTDYQEYEDEEDEEEEKRQNLKFRDTEEEERFHLDREKIRDDRERFRHDNEKFRSRDSDEDEDEDEDEEEEEETKYKKKKFGKKSRKAAKKRRDEEYDDEDDYEDEEEERPKKRPRKNKKNKDVELIETTTTIEPPSSQRDGTFKIATRNSLPSSYFSPRSTTTTTESPITEQTTIAAAFRKRMNIVQEKLKRLNLLPQSTTPLIDISTLIPTSLPPIRPRQPNSRYTQQTTIQPFIIHANDNPKAQYENIADDAQQQKTETQSYAVMPRRYRVASGQNQNNNDASNEQYSNGDSVEVLNNRNINKIVNHYNGAGVTTPISSQNIYFAPRDQPVQVPPPNLYQYNQPKLNYNHPTQIQRPQVFQITPETPNLNPNLIQHPTQSRQIQPQSRIKKQNHVTQPINYETYTLYKRKRDTVPDSSTEIKYSSSYRIINENTTTPNESDVAASFHVPVNIVASSSSGGRHTSDYGDSKSDENERTTVVPAVNKTDGNEAATESKTEMPTRQDNGRKILNQVKYFQDFFAAQLRPDLLEFGHLCEDPNDWEERFERKDMKDERHQGKVRWGDKKGGYGEHYWDLNHHKPKIEDGVSGNADNDKNNNNSKLQTATDDHERDDHDGVEQDGD